MPFQLSSVEKCLGDNDENWQPRLKALVALEEHIRSHTGTSLDLEFYRTLRIPLQKQLLDLRSSIVRETCKTLSTIAKHGGTNSETLLGYCLPNVIEVSAGANKVMSTYASTCLWSVIEHCRGRSVLKHLVDSACHSKNKHIRENCLACFKIILTTWKNLQPGDGEAMLTALHSGLGDASAKARKHAREAYWPFCKTYTRQGETLLADMDPRTQSTLLALRPKISNDSSPGKAVVAWSPPATGDGKSNAINLEREKSPKHAVKQSLHKLDSRTKISGDSVDANTIELSSASIVLEEFDSASVLDDSQQEYSGISQVQPENQSSASQNNNEAGGSIGAIPNMGAILLEKHRVHVDAVLEVLRKEMMLLSDFETLSSCRPSDIALYASNIADSMQKREQLLADLYVELGATCAALK